MGPEIFLERFGPGGEQDGGSALVGRHVLVISHAVPEFLADKRQERMEQPQAVREDEVENGEGVGPPGGVGGWGIVKTLKR